MLDSKNTSIIAIDLQEKLVNMVNDKSIVKNSVNLLKTSKILGLETILTEQYPKGLGATIDEIKSVENFKTIEKTSFSAYQDEIFKKEFKKLKKKNVIIFGIETHICVYQTALNLKEKGYNVYVVADCCASRDEKNHSKSLELMKQEGIKITTLEIVLFELLKSSRHKNFKEIQSLIK